MYYQLGLDDCVEVASIRGKGLIVFGIDENDPDSQLIDRGALDAEVIEQISVLMRALGRLREVEREVSEASARYMDLNETGMRALHFLMVNENHGDKTTPGLITAHLGISTASTTKLLDRLEVGGHIIRHPHPTDRRAQHIQITDETRRAAMDTVGRHQSRRFHSAARLTKEERDVVIRFLQDMTHELDIKHAHWIENEK